MKKRLHYLLSRYPRCYRRMLRALGSSNVEKRTLLQLVQDGDTVLDVGANLGDLTILLSHIVGRAGSVHAFEPVPPTFARLGQRVADEGHFSNVILNPFALGETAGSAKVTVPSGDFGQASLKNHAIASWSQAGREVFDCEVQTLDGYVAEKQIERVDLLKIDIEGAELPALRGATQTLARFHPIIHFEYFAPWTEAFGYQAGDLISFLTSYGYEHFYTGDLTPLRRPAQEMAETTDSQNFIFSPTSIPHA